MRFRDNRDQLKIASRQGLPVVAWVSRHAPTDDQRAALAGYAIVQIGHDDQKFHSPREVWRAVQDECRGTPRCLCQHCAGEALRRKKPKVTAVQLSFDDLFKEVER